MYGGFHGVLTVFRKTLTRQWGVRHTNKGRGSLAAVSRVLKRLERPRRFAKVPLSTEAVDNSVDGALREAAITQSDCIFVTLIKK
jgi:hypothetical protein